MKSPRDAFFTHEQLELMMWALEHSQEYMNLRQLDLSAETIDTFSDMMRANELMDELQWLGESWNAVEADSED